MIAPATGFVHRLRSSASRAHAPAPRSSRGSPGVRSGTEGAWRRFPSATTLPASAKVAPAVTCTPRRALPSKGPFLAPVGPTPPVAARPDPDRHALRQRRAALEASSPTRDRKPRGVQEKARPLAPSRPAGVAVEALRGFVRDPLARASRASPGKQCATPTAGDPGAGASS